MKYELNIGLSTDAGPNNLQVYAERRSQATTTLLKVFGAVSTGTYVSTYLGPQGLVAEPGLYAAFDAHPFTFALVSVTVHRLAATLGQGCIAVRRPQDGMGWLIGPDAARWGSFDPACFVNPFQLQEQAA